DDEQRYADRGAVSELELSEALLVEEERQRLTLPAATAGESGLGSDEQRLGEDLQSADGRHDDGEDDDRPQRGDRQVYELLPAGGAVDRGRLVHLAGKC